MQILDKVFAVIGIIVILTILMTLPLMWLWNWLMPLIFRLIKINFWQALGLSLLSSLLFKPTNSKG